MGTSLPTNDVMQGNTKFDQYVCVCVYVYVCMSVCLSVCMCMCVCLSVCRCMYVCLSVCMCMCVCLSVYMCMFVRVYVCMYVRVYVSACISEIVMLLPRACVSVQRFVYYVVPRSGMHININTLISTHALTSTH